MDHRTKSNKNIEIKRPCLKEIIFLLNLLAQNIQTAKVIRTERKWDVSGVKEEKAFAKYHWTFERKKFVGFLPYYRFLILHSYYFAEQMYLVKTNIRKGSCSWEFLPLH